MSCRSQSAVHLRTQQSSTYRCAARWRRLRLRRQRAYVLQDDSCRTQQEKAPSRSRHHGRAERRSGAEFRSDAAGRRRCHRPLMPETIARNLRTADPPLPAAARAARAARAVIRSGGLGRHSCAACSAEPCAGAAVDAAAASPTARSIGAAFGAAVRAAFGAAAGAARHVRIASKQQS